jgi:glycosyltransferase involved in cell wall biosynthesis
LTSGEIWESRLKAIGVPVRFVGASKSRLVRLATVIQAVRNFRPSVVQSQHFYTNGYSALAAKMCGARSVGGVRGNGLSDLRDCGQMFGKLCLHLPQCLAANSRAAIRNLVALKCPQAKLRYLPNVVDGTRFHPVQLKMGQPVAILGVGSLGSAKRFDRFLRIVGLLRHSSTLNFKAMIAGEGLLRPELEELARSQGLCPVPVEFLGNVPDAAGLYNQVHILLLTSDHEGTPNVVLEAMACGLPVVATGVGDVPDLVQHGKTGFVFPPTDEEAAARHLARLIQDASARQSMGNRARAFIQEHHALESLPGHLARLYSEQLA